MSEISTDLSNEDYIELLKEMKVALSEKQENDERNDVVQYLKGIVSQESGSDTNNKANNVDDNTSDHDYDTCPCHLSQSLQYAANLIESKHVMIPLIKKIA